MLPQHGRCVLSPLRTIGAVPPEIPTTGVLPTPRGRTAARCPKLSLQARSTASCRNSSSPGIAATGANPMIGARG